MKSKHQSDESEAEVADQTVAVTTADQDSSAGVTERAHVSDGF